MEREKIIAISGKNFGRAFMQISADEIDAAKTANGGWTRATLAQWGVPWPPPRGLAQGADRGDARRAARRAARMICLSCGAAFAPTRRDARFCSSRCRVAAHRGVTDQRVTDRGRVTDQLADQLDELGARVQRGDPLTGAEIAGGIALCERVLDNRERGDDDCFVAVNVLARLDAMPVFQMFLEGSFTNFRFLKKRNSVPKAQARATATQCKRTGGTQLNHSPANNDRHGANSRIFVENIYI